MIVAGNGDETAGLGAVGGNHAAATEEPKSLERLGPTQTIAECSSAIPYWASEWPECNAGHCLAFLLALGRGVRNEAIAQCSTLLQRNSEQVDEFKAHSALPRSACS